jgi:hypothetical protein
MKELDRTCQSSRRSFLWLLACGLNAEAQEHRGRWRATFQGRTMGGTWTAQPHSEPDAAYGTWSLLDPAGKRLARGTWGAGKIRDQWEGRWRAEVDGGGKHAGSWTAKVDGEGSLPMIDLFRLAVEQAVSGTWRSDSRLSGTWSIQANRPGESPQEA